MVIVRRLRVGDLCLAFTELVHAAEHGAERDHRAGHRPERREAPAGVALGAHLRQTDLIERDRGEVQRGRAAGFLLAVDVIHVLAVPVLDAGPRPSQHLLPIAPVERIRGALLHASGYGVRRGETLRVGQGQRLPIPLDRRDRVEAIDAEGALRDLGRERIPLRGDGAERTGQHAVTAADADLGVVDDGSLFGLLERRHRTGGDAGRLVAVHALPLGEDVAEPSWRFRVVDFVVRDQHVIVLREGRRVLERPEDAARLQLGDLAVEAVPLLAAHLAGVAPDALGGVDQLGVAHRRPPGRGASDDTASSTASFPAG